MKQKIQEIEISKLNLWSENPRDRIDLNSSDFDIIKRAIEDPFSKWDLKKFVAKMGEYYDYSELPTVVKEHGKYIVYDGNRRLAVLKCLQDKEKYSQFFGKLFPEYEPELLRKQTKIPCNICDKETALINIERKHVDNSSWGAIERDYFSYNFRGKEKTFFQIIDEQTGFITNNTVLNKRFVKEEVLTKKNLEEIGFFIKNGILKSNYTEDQAVDIFLSIHNLIADKLITTRDSRKELKKPLLNKFPKLSAIVNSKRVKNSLIDVDVVNNQKIIEIKTKKTKITKNNDLIFGRDLILVEGIVNDLYCSIDFIDKKTKNSSNPDSALLFIGASLRLILDIAGRIHYRSIGDVNIAEKDVVYTEFLKKAKKELLKEKENFISLTGDWLSDEKSKLDGLLGKYAHGSIVPDRSDILRMSYIVADILEFYFKKKNN